MRPWSFRLCVVALAFAAGCSSCKKKDVVAPLASSDAGPAAPTATEVQDAGPAAAAAEAPADFTPTLSTLSVFEPSDGGCEWRKVDPEENRAFVVARFPGTCHGARSSISVAANRGAVWFDPGTFGPSAFSSKGTFQEAPAPEDAGDRLYAVDLGSAGGATEIPAPTLGELRDFGVDDKGRLLALTLRDLTDAEKEARKVVVAGQTLKMGDETEGIPVVVHALSFEDGGWVRFESKLSTDGWDYAAGTSELAADKELRARSAEALEPRVQGDSVVDDALLAALQAYGPKRRNSEEGEWIFFEVGGERLYLYENVSEFTFNSGVLLRADADGGVAPLPMWPYNENDVVALLPRANFLLATQDIAGTHPRLYEIPPAELRWSSDSARATTFWPVPAAVPPKGDDHR